MAQGSGGKRKVMLMGLAAPTLLGIAAGMTFPVGEAQAENEKTTKYSCTCYAEKTDVTTCTKGKNYESTTNDEGKSCTCDDGKTGVIGCNPL